MKIVRVEWLDAWCNHLETVPRDWKDEQPMTTVGVLVRKTPKLISIAGEVSHANPATNDDTTYRCVTHIPRAYVTSVTELGDLEVQT